MAKKKHNKKVLSLAFKTANIFFIKACHKSGRQGQGLIWHAASLVGQKEKKE